VFLTNVLGLTLSFTFIIVLGAWINQQFEYNRFLENSGVYEVLSSYEVNDAKNTVSATSLPIIHQIQLKVPEVDVVGYMQLTGRRYKVVCGRKELSPIGYSANADFFKVFNRKFLFGNPVDCLGDSFGIVLSESLAIKLFGTDWINKINDEMLLLDGWKPVDVTGVFEDIPKQSSIRFDYLLPLSADNEDHVGNFDYKTFVKITSGNPGQITEKINVQIDELTRTRVFLQRFEDTYLYNEYRDGQVSGGRIEYVMLFVLACTFVLAMSAFNCVNLFLAASLSKMRSMGVRLILGDRIIQQQVQYFIEAFIMVICSSLLALGTAVLILPRVNELFGVEIYIPLQSLEFWFWNFAIIVFTTLSICLYPAVAISSLKAVETLRQSRSSGFGKKYSGHGLIALQLLATCVILFFSYGVGRQISFVLNRNLGYNKEELLVYKVSSQAAQKIEIFKNELRKSPVVVGCTAVSTNLLGGSPMVGGLDWPKKAPTDSTLFGVVFADSSFFNVMGIEVVKGFSNLSLRGSSVPVLINATAAKRMGGEDAIINQEIKVWGHDAVVRGIFSDFNFNSLFNRVEPLIIGDIPNEAEYIFIRVTPQSRQEVVATLQEVHLKIDPNSVFAFYWHDEKFQSMYQNEVFMQRASFVFTLVVVLISCLGIFALSHFNIQRQLKTIAIRRVLGAGTLSLVRLLVEKYLLLTAVSVFVSIPMAYFLVQSWVSKFAYAVGFVSPTLAVVILALFLIVTVTASAHLFKVIRVSPVRHLRLD